MNRALAPDEWELPPPEMRSPAIQRMAEERPDMSKSNRIVFIMDLMADDQWVRGQTAGEIAAVVGLSTNTIEWSAAEASRNLAIMADRDVLAREFVARQAGHLKRATRLLRKQERALNEAADFKERQAAAMSYRAVTDQVDKIHERLGVMGGVLPGKSAAHGATLVIVDAKGNYSKDVRDFFEAVNDVLQPHPAALRDFHLAFGRADVVSQLPVGSVIQDAEIVEDNASKKE